MIIIIIIALISIAWYLTNKGKHTMLYKVNKYTKPKTCYINTIFIILYSMHITPIHTHMDEQKLDPGKMSSEKVRNSKKKVKIMQHNKNQELKLLRQLTSNPGKYNFLFSSRLHHDLENGMNGENWTTQDSTQLGKKRKKTEKKERL